MVRVLECSKAYSVYGIRHISIYLHPPPGHAHHIDTLTLTSDTLCIHDTITKRNNWFVIVFVAEKNALCHD